MCLDWGSKGSWGVFWDRAQMGNFYRLRHEFEGGRGEGDVTGVAMTSKNVTSLMFVLFKI